MLNLAVELVDSTGITAPVQDYTSLVYSEAFNTGSGGSIKASRKTIVDLEDAGGILITDQPSGHKWSAHVDIIKKLEDGTGTATFQSDLTILDGMYPHPSPNDQDLTAASHYVAETVYAAGGLHDLIDANKWQVPGLSVTGADFASSTVTNLRLRLTPTLLKVVEQKGTPNNAVITVVTDEAGGWVCHCRSGTVTDEVFSSEKGSLTRLEEVTREPTVTHVLAGGSGGGTARLFRTGSRPDGRPRHKFLDLRSVDTIAALDIDIAEALEEGRRRASFKANLTSSDRYRYGVDFSVGDQARIWIDGQEYTEPITKATTKVDGHQVTRTIVVGFDQPDPLAAASLEAAAVSSSLADLLGET